MASEVDICNIALAHLGDSATVASINPPEGSAQSEHCARFYPVARDTLLEMHAWSFATRRSALALLDVAISQWKYIYAMPTNVVNVIAVIPPDSVNDYSAPAYYSTDQYGYNAPQINPAAAYYTPQDYSIETLSTGAQVICTNQENAVLRYTQRVTDTTQFSPLFNMSLTWLLASMLAGPVIKGDVGAAEGKRCYQMFQAHFVEATQSDAVQRQTKPQMVVPWIAGR